MNGQIPMQGQYDGRSVTAFGNSTHTYMTPPSVSPSKIRDLLGATEEGSTQLHSVISQLEERLSTVLTPASPNVSAPKGLMESPPISDVQQRVLTVNAGFAHAIDRLNEILRRIEV